MIVGVDQAMLDLVVNVDSDLGIFDRYGIEQNTQCLADERHASLFQDLIARAYSEDDKGGDAQASSALPSVRRTPGGIVANSLRAAAWSLKAQQQQGKESAAIEKTAKPELKMMGMVADDYAGNRLRQELVTAGVEPLMAVRSTSEGRAADAPLGLSEGTGLCCCLIAGKERTMVTELGAGKTLELQGSWASRIKEATVRRTEANLPSILVTSAFYVQADPEGARTMLAWAHQPREDGRPTALVAFAISAQWCCNLPVVQELAREADILFANEPEIVSLAAALRRESALPQASSPEEEACSEACLKAVAAWKAHGWVIATRGSKSVGALEGGAGAKRTPLLVPVPRLPQDELADDIGAGDSFMGGFLASVWQRLASRAAGSSPSPASGGGGGGCGDGLWQKWLREGCCAYRRPAPPPPVARQPLLKEAPAKAELLTDGDIEAAVKAGIHTAAACLRCVGCQFPDLRARPAA